MYDFFQKILINKLNKIFLRVYKLPYLPKFVLYYRAAILASAMSAAPKSRMEKLQFVKRTAASADADLVLLEEGDCPCIDIAELLD